MIKNIIFDVGDVLIEYRWKNMLMEHGLTEQEAVRIGTEIFDNELWSQKLDMGLMSPEEAAAAYRELYPEDGDIIHWFITHGELMPVGRPKIWEKIPKLKQRYGIYLLSNYSDDLFHKHTKGAPFLEYLDGRIVSYEVHKIKPDPAIYQCLLEKYSLQPQECLFFDDRQDNVQMAQKLGFWSQQVFSQEHLSTALDALLA